MTPEAFTYWLQGFVEVAKRQPTPEEWQQICDHLQTVFRKVTPPANVDSSSPYWYQPATSGTRIC